MAPARNAGRIDHVAMLVAPENFEACIVRFTAILGGAFVRADRPDLGLLIAMDWDSGLELLAPTGPDSPFWPRLQKGEGQVSIIFGVDDLDAAKARARAEGVAVGPEIGLTGDEPWADRFEVLREAALAPIAGINLVLGEIRPRVRR